MYLGCLFADRFNKTKESPTVENAHFKLIGFFYISQSQTLDARKYTYKLIMIHANRINVAYAKRDKNERDRDGKK